LLKSDCFNNKMGREPIFLFVEPLMELVELLESTLSGMGYELIDVERSNSGRLLRVFIDKSDGITIDDCALVSNQLSRVLEVEAVDYDRLEVSSPGLDRPLRDVKDFKRFEGEKARIRVRVPVAGQKNFVGILRDADAQVLRIEVDGALVSIAMDSIEKARLIPQF
jgi:ribosome maturation factor RimP